MPCGYNFNSNVFQKYLYMAGVIQVSVWMVCRIVDESTQLMFPF